MNPTALLVDDEPAFRVDLGRLLNTHFPEIRIAGEAGSVPEGADVVMRIKPDLLFLDVEMGALTGFDLLKRIAPFQPQVIFTTGHENYAVKAIRFNALDYLLKPIDEEDFCNAVHRALRALREPVLPDRIPALLGSVVSDRQVALPVQSGLELVHLDDILYCKGDDNYTEVHFRENTLKTLVISRTLKELDEFLSGRGFIRIHKSYLVHVKHIRSYHRGDGGEVTMANKATLPVSRAHKQDLLDALDRLQMRPVK